MQHKVLGCNDNINQSQMESSKLLYYHHILANIQACELGHTFFPEFWRQS